jgi:WD40 repeat protein
MTMKDDSKKDPELGTHDDDETPAIYSISRTDGQTSLDRRSFVEIAAVVAGTLSLGTVCRTTSTGKRAEVTPEKPEEAGRDLRSAKAHGDPITALAVNDAGKLLASADNNGTLKLWQLPEGVLLQTWPGHESSVSDLVFPSEDDTLWSLDSSGTLKRWRLPDGEEISDGQSILGGHSGSGAFAVPIKGNWYAVQGAERAVELRSKTTGETLRTLADLDDDITDLAVTPDGTLLFAGGTNGKLSLWIEPIETHGGAKTTDSAEVSAVAIAETGGLAVSAHADQRLRIWELPELAPGAEYEIAPDTPFCVAIRPQQDQFVAGSEKPEIELWKLDGTAEPELLKGHTAAVRALAITPDGSLLISGGDDKTIRLWSLPSGESLQNLVDLEVNTSNVDGVTFEGTDIYGRNVVFTLPCGSPIPAGAVCTCNCVPGSLAMPANHSQTYSAQGFCTCDLICTCNAVCTCQGVCTCQTVGNRYVSYWYPN